MFRKRWFSITFQDEIVIITIIIIHLHHHSSSSSSSSSFIFIIIIIIIIIILIIIIIIIIIKHFFIQRGWISKTYSVHILRISYSMYTLSTLMDSILGSIMYSFKSSNLRKHLRTTTRTPSTKQQSVHVSKVLAFPRVFSLPRTSQPYQAAALI